MSVSAVHEEVHQGTGEQDEIGEGAEHVGLVLREKQEARNGNEAHKHPFEARVRRRDLGRIRLIGHGGLHFRTYGVHHLLQQASPSADGLAAASA
jgi:hypothetical protein